MCIRDRIIRTAGAKTTSTEIKRDYKYLTKTWDKIKEDTLSSNAPALIYEDGGVIQRTLRDLYTKDVDNIYVEGSEIYKITKNFMKLLMPSHAVKVKQWKESSPIFQKNNIENQLSSIYADEVYLPSGGSLVLNQTEALVAIDVNSGSSTKYYNIEETAIKTNLEAATEIARQLRLRDMAGLVVIDFIDMEKFQNRRSVEKKLKESLKSDRSKIQVGKISSFGLLEMSRQRIRASIQEGVYSGCTYCDGTGLVRSIDSRALEVLKECCKDDRPVIFARAISTKDETLNIVELSNTTPEMADMRTMVIVGSSQTRLIERTGQTPWVYTPRPVSE